jgi:hypothetical protein
MDPCLKDMLKQVVYVRAPLETSVGGTPTLGQPVAINARVEFDVSLSAGVGNGTQRTPGHFFVTEYPVTMDMRVYLPGDDQTNPLKGKRPSAVVAHYDERRADVDHYEVML